MATTPERARVEQRRPGPAGADHWFALDPAAVLARVGSDAERGLGEGEAASRLAEHGPNQISGEKPPSVWQVALAQLRDPMNVTLVAVTAVSFVIGEVPTAIIVAALILLNVVLGSRQELKARASVDALSRMQVPQSRVVRDGHVVSVAASEIVPGDVLQVEAGDIVPADGRILRSATLEAQEAALTGESAPVSKDAAVLAGDEVALGESHSSRRLASAHPLPCAASALRGYGMGTGRAGR
jgi:P-type Ca2+ transporter type 2C